MEFRRLACASAASARPSLALYARALRQFGTSAARAAGNDQNDKNSPSPMAGLFDTLFSTPRAPSSFRPNFSPSANQLPLSHLNVPQKPPKMGPTAGRSVVVQGDVAQAFMRLRSIISQNKVRQDFHYQKFHERPGLKRKRLRSERHRRRFKEGFKRMVALVMDMRKKGM
ncbi:hypothetical protein FN846DRAFT_894624 [Sphaerosporella brunnea]|uniref:Ribosomal protein S21 n=1 Tax=Sphaerosporella brunnea TaxID=1250544 RepID=A0A5J5EI55_9PEZI|nr:hypothetical protein FN846DRAFT_894624 [Sphaerosporella brunnea]